MWSNLSIQSTTTFNTKYTVKILGSPFELVASIP